MSLSYCNQCGRKRHVNRRTKTLRRCKCGDGWGTHGAGPQPCGMFFRISREVMLTSKDLNAPILGALEHLSRSMTHFMRKTGLTHTVGDNLKLVYHTNSYGSLVDPLNNFSTLGIKDLLEWRPNHNRHPRVSNVAFEDWHYREVLDLWRGMNESR